VAVPVACTLRRASNMHPLSVQMDACAARGRIAHTALRAPYSALHTACAAPCIPVRVHVSSVGYWHRFCWHRELLCCVGFALTLCRASLLCRCRTLATLLLRAAALLLRLHAAGWLQGTWLLLVSPWFFDRLVSVCLARRRVTLAPPLLCLFLQRSGQLPICTIFVVPGGQQSSTHPVSGASTAASSALLRHQCESMRINRKMVLPWPHTNLLSRKAAEGGRARASASRPCATPFGYGAEAALWVISRQDTKRLQSLLRRCLFWLMFYLPLQ
jgi:hypothetical protein